MKYAFMTFSCPQLELDEVLGLARRYGYDGIEPRLGAQHGHGIEWDTTAEQRQTIRQRVTNSGVALACLATSCRYADPSSTAQNVSDTRRALDLAADIGCPRLRVFGGAFPDHVNRLEAIDRVSDALGSVAAEARQRGVTICLETHDSWTNPDHVAQVLRKVDHPAVAANWDFWHPVRQSGWAIGKAFEVLKPWIRHVHFHDGLARVDQFGQRAVGEGELDIRLVLQLLREAGFDGYLSGEWINWEPPEVHLPREIAAARKIEQALG